MKKGFYISLILVMFFVLSACGLETSEIRISGNVSGFIMNEKNEVVSFVVQVDEEEIGVLVNEDTYIFSWIDGITSTDFETGSLRDVVVSVDCIKPQKSLTTQNGTQTIAYEAEQIEIKSYKDTEPVVLSDGTSVDIWHHSDATLYKLQNDMMLLRVENPIGPKDVFGGGTESLNDLNPEAQRKIMDFYEEQGLFYNEAEELEKAYQDYLNTDDSTQFDGHRISQEIWPTASNETMIYFMTTVLLPMDDTHGYEIRVGAAFDKTTGEYISNLELFSCDEDQVLKNLLEISEETDSALIKEMEQAFKPENIILFPNAMEVCFQYGTLPSQEYVYLLGFDYDEILKIMNDWAIPINTEE